MIIYDDIIQGSDEWFEIKLGKFSASKTADLLMKKTTAGYNNLINEIVFKRLTGKQPEENYSNFWMDRGIELEPDAIKKYELMTFNKVQKTGFVEMNEWVGCSPDGLIGNDGLIQIKCPKFSTHIDYLLSHQIPSDYYKQMQFEMMVTERQYNIFFSYHPDLKPFIEKIKRDDNLVEEIKQRLAEAIKEVKQKIEILNN